MKLKEILLPENVFPDLRAKSRDEALAELMAAVSADFPAPRGQLIQLLIEREDQSPTAMSGGVAVPHVRIAELDRFILSLGRSRLGIPFGADDGLTNIFFLMFAPTNDTVTHLKILARIARISRNPHLRAEVMAAKTGPEIYQRIMTEDAGT